MYLMWNETFENHIHFITGLQSSLQLALQKTSADLLRSWRLGES